MASGRTQPSWTRALPKAASAGIEHGSAQNRDDAGVPVARREAWEIAKNWWQFVPGGALGVLAIVEVIHDTRGKTGWFLGFCAMTALFLATAARLRRVVQERNSAQTALAGGGTREALADRLDRFQKAWETLRGELPPDPGPGSVFTEERERWREDCGALRGEVTGELRQYAEKFVVYWRSNPPARTHNFDTDANADVDAARERLAYIAQRLREGQDAP